MTVAAKINKLPVLVTDADVRCRPPNDIQMNENEWEVSFGVEKELESCCGVMELGRAVGYYGEQEFQDGLPPEAQAAMVEALNSIAPSGGLLLYHLTDNQKVEAEALVEAGFEVMAIFKNPNSGNRITMYGLLMNQPRAKPVAAKKAKKKPVRR